MRPASVIGSALVAGSLLVIPSCASVWGFDPLTLAPQDGGVIDATTPDSGTFDAGEPLREDASSLDATAPACSVACEAGTDALAPAAGLTCEQTEGVCDCDTGGAGDTAGCSASTLGVASDDVLCCQDPNYPQSGSCQCEWLGCTASGSTCICGAQTGQPGTSCVAGSWTCCLQTSAPGCVCSDGPCSAGYTAHGSSCDVSDMMACSGAQHAVSDCR